MLLNLLTAVLSLLVLVFAALLWRRQLTLARQIPGTPRSLTADLRQIAGLLSPEPEPATQITPMPEAIDSPIDSDRKRVLRAFIQCFNVWKEVAASTLQLSVVTRKGITRIDIDLRNLLNRSDLELSIIRQAQLDEDIQSCLRTICIFALNASDKDLDKERSHQALQSALEHMLDAAGFKLYCPAPGSTYELPGSRQRIRVASVLARGIVNQEGKIVSAPEIKRMY